MDPSVATLHIDLLGPLGLRLGDEAIPRTRWRNRPARRLLLRLAGAGWQGVGRDEAMELLWPGHDPVAAGNNLKVTVRLLRLTLDPGMTAESRARYVLYDGERLALNPAHLGAIDADLFERRARSAGAHDPAELAATVALYAGDYLAEDPYEDWAVPRRELLRSTWLRLLRTLADSRSPADPRGALAALERLLEAEPSHEDAARRAMRLYADLGERPAVARCFRRLEEALRRDLDVPPEAETTALAQALLARPAIEQRALPASPPARRPPAPFRVRGPFVGREREVHALRAALDALEHGPSARFIGGEPGIGKTRLIHECANDALARGLMVLHGACRPEEQSWPYAPLAAALGSYCRRQDRDQLRSDLQGCAALGRLLPELLVDLPDLTLGPALSGGQERRVLHHALATFIRRIAPGGGLLLLDDLQWAGPATLAALRELLDEEQLPLLIVATYRDGEVDPRHPLAALITGLARLGTGEQLLLGPLDAAQARSLAVQLGAPQDLPDDLLGRAGGNPLLAEGLLAALRTAGWTVAGDGEIVVADLVAQSIRQRVAMLPDPAEEVLFTAAVVGERIPRGLVQRAARLPDEAVIATLEAAQRAQLLRQTEDGYAFAHGLIRDVLYGAIGRERRELLHGRVGEALAASDTGDQPGSHAALAYHFRRSPHHREAAIEALIRAGREAARLYANAEAVEHLQAALDLLRRLPATHSLNHRIGSVQTMLADIRTLQGEPAAAVAALRAALDLAREPEERAALLRRLGSLAAGLGEEGAGAYFAEAELLLAPLPRGPEWGRLRLAMARVLIDRAEPAPALPLLQEALALFEAESRAGRDVGDLAASYNALGGRLLSAGASEDSTRNALDCFRQALALWQQVGDQDGVGRAAHNLGLGHRLLAEWDLAIEQLRRAEEIAMRTGSRRLLALARANLGECLMAMGRWAEARVACEEAAERADRAGQIATAAHACANAGWICLAAGDLEAAGRWLGRSLDLAERLASASHRWFTLRGLGRLAEARGALAEAEEHYRAALRVAGSQEPRCQVGSLIDLARVGRLRGDDGSSAADRALAQQELDAQPAGGESGGWAGLAGAALALERGLALAGGADWPGAEPALLEAASRAEGVAAEPAEALAVRIEALLALGLTGVRRAAPGDGVAAPGCAAARAQIERAAKLARRSGRAECTLSAGLALAEAALVLGEYGAAREAIAGVRDAAARAGYAALSGWAAVLRAWQAQLEGLPEAGDLAARALCALESPDLPSMRQRAHALLG